MLSGVLRPRPWATTPPGHAEVRTDPTSQCGPILEGARRAGGGGRVDGLGRRVLVAAFDGWNDAGEAASSAIAHLRDNGKYETVFSVDPELYFDYQYTRPQVAIDGEGKRTLRWPEATLLKPTRTTRGTQLWLLSGVEPARAWQAFAAEFIDFA